MSVLEIISRDRFNNRMVTEFSDLIDQKDFQKLSKDFKIQSFQLKNILANIAAEKNSLPGLIYTRSINCDMNNESMILPTSFNEQSRTGRVTKNFAVRSPLFWACYHKNLRMLKFLIDSKVNLFHRSRSTTINNPLFIAIENGFFEGVKLLITNRFRYTKISTGSLANFYELLQDTTIATFNREIQTPFKLDTVQIIDFLLSYRQNRYDSFLRDEHQGFLRYIRNRSFVHFRHYFLKSYPNIPRLFSSERTEIGEILWTNYLSKRKARYYLQNFKKISLLYEILCNEDLSRTIVQYI